MVADDAHGLSGRDGHLFPRCCEASSRKRPGRDPRAEGGTQLTSFPRAREDAPRAHGDHLRSTGRCPSLELFRIARGLRTARTPGTRRCGFVTVNPGSSLNLGYLQRNGGGIPRKSTLASFREGNNPGDTFPHLGFGPQLGHRGPGRRGPPLPRYFRSARRSPIRLPLTYA